jgi:hydrogenase nickel incorporation protein HypA/HybF
MHELSIAQGIVEVAAETAHRHQAVRVNAVNLKLGRLAGVESGALLFSYDIVAAGTVVEGSRLSIIDVPLVVWCSHCLQEVTLPEINQFRCPICGVAAGEIRHGRELEIESLEIET